MTAEVETRDVCTDCGRVFRTADLFSCSRWHGDDWILIRLCIDCLYAVNPHMQRDLIEAALGSESQGQR